MNLTRWEPYREIVALQDRLNRAFGSTFARPERDDEMSLAAWAPPVDIAEEKDRILITAELPGFKEDEIEIQSENGMLTLRGERKFEKEHDGKSYHRVERSYGQFVRSFSLPNNVDREKIKADFSNGLLRIELPKREDAKPRTIRISAGAPENKAETIDVKSR
jgi:HSP20 family protein